MEIAPTSAYPKVSIAECYGERPYSSNAFYRYKRRHQSHYCSTVFTYKHSSASKPAIRVPPPSPPPLRSPRRNITTEPKRAIRCPVNTTTDILRLMDSLRLPVPADLYISLIRECTINGDATQAAELHDHVRRSALPAGSLLLNRLLLMYVSCGLIDVARQLFDKMTNKDFNSWAILIGGYVDSEDYHEAIYVFAEMLQRNNNNCIMESTGFAWILDTIIKACIRTGNMGLGEQVHGWLLKVGYSTNLYVGSSLIDFYAKFNCHEDANFVFDQMPCHDTVTWTARIVNNCRHEHFNEVLDAFIEMGKAGIKKNPFTFSSVIRACGRLKENNRQCGGQVHANAVKLGIESNLFVQCALVDMYGKYGLLRDARKVFEMIGDKRNAACWNAMLTGYIQNGVSIEAVKILYKMKDAGVQPQESLVNEVRIACGGETFTEKDDQINAETTLCI